MSRRLYSYQYGEPVWARLDGHPWWPGRVVTPDEVSYDEGEPKPSLKVGELLIEFFDETRSFAPLKVRHVRPFLSKRRTNIHRQVENTKDHGLEEAISRMQQYVIENDWIPAEYGKQASAASARLQYTPARPVGFAEHPKPRSKTAQSPAHAEKSRSEPKPRKKQSRQSARRAEPGAKRLKRMNPNADTEAEPGPEVTKAVISKAGRAKKRRKNIPAKETSAKDIRMKKTPAKETSAKETITRDADLQELSKSTPPAEVEVCERVLGPADRETTTVPTLGRRASEDNRGDSLDDSAIPTKRKKRTIATETLESSVVDEGETYLSLKKEMASLLRDRDDRIAALHARMEKLERDDLIKTGQEMIRTGQELTKTVQDLIQKCGPVLESAGLLLQRVTASTDGSTGDVQTCSGFVFMANK